MYYVYLLECADKSLYTGITNDLEKRLKQHKNKKGGRYTASHKAKKFVHTEPFATKGEALKRELEIKSLPRKKKLELIKSK